MASDDPAGDRVEKTLNFLVWYEASVCPVFEAAGTRSPACHCRGPSFGRGVFVVFNKP